MLTIQLARPSDWPHIQAGLACTHLDEGVLTADVNAVHLVAYKDGRFAGFCMVEQCGDVAVLPALFVEGVFRSKGIASHLVSKCVAHAIAKGTRWLFTACQPEGVTFLEQLGFEVERPDLVPVEVLKHLVAAGGNCLTLLSMPASRDTSKPVRKSAAFAAPSIALGQDASVTPSYAIS